MKPPKQFKIIETPVRYFPSVGGVETTVKNLAEGLVRLGHRVTVLTAREPGQSVKEVIRGVKVHRLSAWFKLTNTNVTLLLPFRLLTADFDVIHTHLPTPWTADVSVIVAYLRRKKSVLTIYNDIKKTGFFPRLLTKIYLTTIFRLTIRLTDRITVDDRNWRRDWREMQGLLMPYADKISFIPIGIDMQFFRPGRIAREKNTCLFVSVLDRHHDYKGLDDLLAAVKTAAILLPKLRLVVIGDGDKKRFYENLALNLGISNRVVFAGRVSELVLRDYYRRASLFVLPSKNENEGFGIVALEALATGLPVIVTKRIGVAGVVANQNSGLLVPENNPRQLARALVRFFNSKPPPPRFLRQAVKNYANANICRIYERIFLSLDRSHQT